MRSGERQAAATTAKLLVVLLGLAWGFNWIATRIVLEALPPWTLRTVGIALGAATLFAAAAIRGVSLSVPRAERMKIVIAGFFNVAIFGVCSAYSQVYGTTSRAVVIAYSMPIWAALLARIVLKERLNAVKLIALSLCAAGLAVLIWPLTRNGLPLGALLALGCALSWAAGTIYLKWAKHHCADADLRGLAIIVRRADAGGRHVGVRWPAAFVAAAAAYPGVVGL